MKILLWPITGGLALLLAFCLVLLSSRWTETTPASAMLKRGGSGARISSKGDSTVAVLVGLLATEPFRASRRAAVRRYQDESLSASEVSPPLPVRIRPRLRIAGYAIAGDRSSVLVDGLPEPGGSALLTEGDSTRGITLIRLNLRTATIRGFDTTWVLAVQPEESP